MYVVVILLVKNLKTETHFNLEKQLYFILSAFSIMINWQVHSENILRNFSDDS